MSQGPGQVHSRRCLLPVICMLVAGGALFTLLHNGRGSLLLLSFGGLGIVAEAAVKEETSIDRAKRLLVESDAVFFDVDSTVVKTEGINLLGNCFGIMKEIENLTTTAMNGNIKFQDAMAQRLELMAAHGMTKSKLDECVRVEGRPRWTRGVREVVRRMHAAGKHVYLVSGGFKAMIGPVAKKLGIPEKRIFGNTILFDADGNYAGFDQDAPTSRSGGKPAVLTAMAQENGYGTMIMIGDGATDMDARIEGPAAAFIGYGGVTAREKIKKNADWFIYSFSEVLAVLPRS